MLSPAFKVTVSTSCMGQPEARIAFAKKETTWHLTYLILWEARNYITKRTMAGCPVDSILTLSLRLDIPWSPVLTPGSLQISTMAPLRLTLPLVIANLLIPVAILSFASGFFPYKPFLPGLAEYEALDIGSPPGAPFQRVIFMVVDALRRYGRPWHLFTQLLRLVVILYILPSRGSHSLKGMAALSFMALNCWWRPKFDFRWIRDALHGTCNFSYYYNAAH